MSTRQVANLLAAAAPEVVPSRDTLRAGAPDRYTLKVSIDQECEQGLRLLKDLMSHVDPRMSWGGLVAHLVREGVARHDPRGSGRQRRQRSAGASTRRAPHKTRAAGAPGGPAQGETNPRGGRRIGHVLPAQPHRLGAERTILRRRRVTPPLLEGGTRSRYWPTPLHRGDQRPLHGPTALPQVALQRPRPPLPRRRSRRLRHCRTVPKPVPGVYSDGGLNGASDGAAGKASADGCQAATEKAVSPVATPAPEPAPGVFPDGGLPGASAEAAAGASAVGSAAGAGMPVSPLVSPAPEPAPGVSPDGSPSGVSTGAAAHTARDSVHSRHQSPPWRHIPAAVRRHIWQRDGGRCCYRDPLTRRRCTSPHLLQTDHLFPVAEGDGPDLFNLQLLSFAHRSLRHGHGSAAPPERPM